MIERLAEDLQAVHAAFSWPMTRNDHEFDNDDVDHNSEQLEVAAEGFLRCRANAYQAYYEHMPLPPSYSTRS